MTTTDEMVANANKEAKLVIPTLSRIVAQIVEHNKLKYGLLLDSQSQSQAEGFRISKELVAKMHGDISSISQMAWSIAAAVVAEDYQPWPLSIVVVTNWTNAFLKIKLFGSTKALTIVNVENPGIFSTLLNQQDVQPNTTEQKEETVDNQTQVMEHYFSLLEDVFQLRNESTGAIPPWKFNKYHSLSQSIASLENEHKYLADVRNYRSTLLGKGLDELEQLMSRVSSDNKVAKFCIEKEIAKHKAPTVQQVPADAFNEYITVSDEYERITLMRGWNTQLDRGNLDYFNGRIHALAAIYKALPNMYCLLKEYRAQGDIDFYAAYHEHKQQPFTEAGIAMVLDAEFNRRQNALAAAPTNLYASPQHQTAHVITPQYGTHLRTLQSATHETIALRELKSYGGSTISISKLSGLMRMLNDAIASELYISSSSDYSQMVFEVRICDRIFEFTLNNSSQVGVMLKQHDPRRQATIAPVSHEQLARTMSGVLSDLKPRETKLALALSYLGAMPGILTTIPNARSDREMAWQGQVGYSCHITTTLVLSQPNPYSLVTNVLVALHESVRCSDLTALMVKVHAGFQGKDVSSLQSACSKGNEVKQTCTVIDGRLIAITVSDTMCGLSEEQQADYDVYMSARYS